MFLEICRQMRLSLHKYIGLLIVTVILITACQSGAPNSQNLENVQGTSNDCRAIEHAGGETTICGQPQKVVALEPKVLSMMLALDVQPAAYADAYLLQSPQFDNPSQQIPYLGQFVTSQPVNLGERNQPSLERLALLKPDLILGINAQENPQLSAIAPTVLIDIDTVENWKDNLQVVAQALAREDRVQQVIDSHHQQLAEVRTQLSPLVNSHPRVLHVVCSQLMDYIEIQYPDTSGGLAWLLKEIGFQTVMLDGVEHTPGMRHPISIETLAQLDADIIFVYTWLDDWDGTSDYEVPLKSLQQKWAGNPLLHNSRAWQEEKVYFVDYTLWGGVIGGPTADVLRLEKLPELLLSQQSSKRHLNPTGV
jgi:iron complex transport system substrate-binding protein